MDLEDGGFNITLIGLQHTRLEKSVVRNPPCPHASIHHISPSCYIHKLCSVNINPSMCATQQKYRFKKYSLLSEKH